LKKNHFALKTAFLLTLLAAIVGIERVSHYMTDGFGIASISSNIPPHEIWETAISSEDQLETRHALSQDYHYLASGSQSYVFLSNDGKYVIKFFKHKRWRLNPFYAFVPLPSKWEKKRTRWKEKKWETVNDTFSSCKISYELFKDETGVLFVHLNKTNNLKMTLPVKDKVGFKHKLALDKLQFVLQRKAVPTDEYLLNLRKLEDTETAKKAIHDMLTFTKKRAQLGYSDKDPHLIRNFGFIEGKAVEIDIGGFHKDPKKGFKYYESREIFKIEEKLLPWIRENYPEIAAYTEKQIDLLSN